MQNFKVNKKALPNQRWAFLHVGNKTNHQPILIKDKRNNKAI